MSILILFIIIFSTMYMIISLVPGNTAVLDNMEPRPREKEGNDNEGMKAAKKRTQIVKSNLFKLQLSKFLDLHM